MLDNLYDTCGEMLTGSTLKEVIYSERIKCAEHEVNVPDDHRDRLG